MDVVRKIQLQHPYTSGDYTTQFDLSCPWEVLSESADGDDIVLVNLSEEKHLLFNIKREYLLSIIDIRNIKIDDIIL